MTISSTNAIVLNAILVEEVCLCSGSSNLELVIQRIKPLLEKEIKSATDSIKYYLKIPKR
tara:strand:- start:7617 stop:7796 length:180 start_codon:yes stop_codon:yes gene_type:complete